MPIKGQFVIPRPSLNIVYMCTKFDDSSIRRTRHMIGAPKFKMGHVTLTTPMWGCLSSLG